jgi:hypothetical protein
VTDPASVGWAARLVSKLPSWRGFLNYLYVAANWSRISEELETYRRQIKDREEWAAHTHAQQEQLHKLGMQRAELELQVEREKWARLAAQISEQRDNLGAQRDTILELADRIMASLLQATQIIEARSNALADCTIVLAVLLRFESPANREVFFRPLDEGTRRAVEHMIKQIEREFPSPGRQGVTWPPGLGSP